MAALSVSPKAVETVVQWVVKMVVSKEAMKVVLTVV